MAKKGISMPINMLVILAVAVIVLLAVVAFFMGGFETDPVDEQAIRNACCSEVVTQGHCGPGADEDQGWDDLADNDDFNATVGGDEVVCGEHLTQDPIVLCC